MTDKTPPMAFTWHADMGEHGAMVCRDRRGRDVFEADQTYRLVVEKGRSQRSHNHEFAVIEEAWRNLPDHIARRFPSPKHFRKHLLIKRGYSTSTEIACGTPETAASVAAHLRVKDDYALVIVRGTVVVEYVAESQSKKAMGAKRFQQSKQDIIEEAAAMIGVSVEDLAKNAGRAA